MPKQNVRIGVEGSSKRSRVIIAFVVVAVAAALAAAGMLVRWGNGAEPVKKNARCEADAECGPGRICARGGCLPLLAGESPGAWRADLDAQARPGSGWAPYPDHGERLAAASVCPIPEGAAAPLDPAKIEPIHSANLVEIHRGGLRVYTQLRIKGTRWIEAMRLALPIPGPVDPARACASPSVSHAAAVPGRPNALDVGLKQTVPVGGIAAAAVAVEAELPPADPDGLRRIAIPVDPVVGAGVGVTVVAMPLGASVERLSGPAPSRQRLLRSHVLYYWRHGAEARRIALSFSVERTADNPLALEEVRP